MRSIVHLALALALLQPALRGQLSGWRGLVRYITFETGRANERTSLFTDNSGDCWSVTYTTFSTPAGNTYQIIGTPVALDISCDCAIGTTSFAQIQPATERRGQFHSSTARPDASSALSARPIWIGSDTTPSTAPTAMGAVYVIDPSTFEPVAAIPLSGKPSALAANHAGTYVYAVTSPRPGPSPGPSMIAAIDTSSYRVAQTINLPQGVNPGIPALSADDRYLYVPNSGTAGGVLVINTQNPSSITTIPTTVTYPKLTQPAAVAQVAVTPDGQLLFAWGSYNIFVIDTAAAQQIGQILLPTEQGNEFLQNQQDTGSNYFVIDPTGSRIYAFANYGSGPSNTWTGYLYAYDTASLSLAGSVELAQNVDVDSIGITPDGSTVFVSSFVYADGENPVFAIDAQSLAMTQSNPRAPSVSLSDGFWQTLLVVLQ